MLPLTLFKALADDTRLKCVLLIHRERELCVCELTDALQLSQPKISRHLALLREARLLLDRCQGQWVYYRLNPELPQWATEIIDNAHYAAKDDLDEIQTLRLRQGPDLVRQSCC